MTRFETSAVIAYKSDKLSQASFAFSVDNHDFMDISGAELKKDGLSALAKRINQSELGVSAKVLNEIIFSTISSLFIIVILHFLIIIYINIFY